MKNISQLSVVSCATLLISANSFAAPDYKAEHYKDGPAAVVVPVVPQVGLKDGFYAGVGLGYDAYKFRDSLSIATGEGGIASFNPQLSAKGWNGSLLGGYGQYFDRFYFAGEVFVNGSNAGTSYSFGAGDDANFNTSLDVRSGYGVAILPGLKVNNFTLLYARLGFVRTQFKSQEKAKITGLAVKNVSTTSWGNGVNYGVGIETAVYPCVSMRGEYTYTTYGSFNSPVGTKFSPSNNQFVLSAIYHFA